MTPPPLTPARYAVLVGLLGGVAFGVLSVGMTTGMTTQKSTRVGPEETTRFARGLWFSPWYERVERRTPTTFESHSEVRALSWSWVGLGVAAACFVTLIRLTAWPGLWLRERAT